MNAVVLSGGGAKGSYHIGVWKALRRLNFKYDIVTGSSAGALNAAFMVQKEYHRALHLWKNMSYDFVFNKETIKKKNFVKNYVKDITQIGGIDISNLEKHVSEYINPKKFFKSNVDFGLITYNLTNFKEQKILKKDLTKSNIKDYLIASASVFPIFPIKEIDGKNYIDGGYYDVMPINLALEMGADKVVAVDLKSIGMKKKVKTDKEIIYIRPNNDIGPFLGFDSKYTNKGINYGYNDCLKVFGVYEGNKYTFKKSKLEKIFKKSNNFKSYDDFLCFLDYLMKLFDYEDDSVYLFKKVINEMDEVLEGHDLISREYVKNSIRKKDIKKLFDTKYVLKYLRENKDDKLTARLFKKEKKAIEFIEKYKEN